MSILEKEACKEKDLKEANRIKRYSLRNQIEKIYHEKNFEEDSKKKKIMENKYSYRRYNVPETRGYDIMTLEAMEKVQKENKMLKHNVSDWENICNNSKGVLKNNISTLSEKNPMNQTTKKSKFKLSLNKFYIFF